MFSTVLLKSEVELPFCVMQVMIHNPQVTENSCFPWNTSQRGKTPTFSPALTPGNYITCCPCHTPLSLASGQRVSCTSGEINLLIYIESKNLFGHSFITSGAVDLQINHPEDRKFGRKTWTLK